jgi:uncharacterized protein (DUF2267 family)
MRMWRTDKHTAGKGETIMKTTRAFGTAPIPGALVLLAILLVQTLAAPVYAQTDNTEPDLFATYLMWRDIEIINVCNRIGLTSDQAALAAVAIQEPWRQLEAIWAVEGSEALRTAIAKMRAVLLRGHDIGEDLWIEVAAARRTIGEQEDDDDGLERHKAELADEIAKGFLSVLTPEQLSKLFAPPATEFAADVAEELAAARAKSPAEWAEFKAEVHAEVSNFFDDNPLPEDSTLLADVDAFLERVRKMDTDTYFKQHEKLTTEFIALLAAARPADTNMARIRAQNEIAGWAETPGLMQLLKDMAVADRSAIEP